MQQSLLFLGCAASVAWVGAGCGTRGLVPAAGDAGMGGVPAPGGLPSAGGGASGTPDLSGTSAGGGVDAAAPLQPGACQRVSWGTAQPYLVAPISGSIVTSARPRLRWGGGGDHVSEIQVCADRNCAHVVAQFTTGGDEAEPPEALPPGYWFWRVRPVDDGRQQWTAPWCLRVRPRFAGYAPAANTAVDGFADYNGDGYPDVAMAGSASAIYLGGPDGVASERTLPLGVPASSPGAFHLPSSADVNGDGFADFSAVHGVAVAGQGWPNYDVFVYFGSLAGLTGLATLTTVITDYFPLWIGSPRSIGDIDGDGFGDLVLNTRYPAYVIRGCAPGLAPVPWGSLICGSCQLQQIVTGDFNGDGRSDVIFADAAGMNVYMGNPDGLRPASFPDHNAMTAIDFNYDGYSDLVVRQDWPAFALDAHEGGPGGLSPVFSTAPQPLPFDVAGDFNGDGYWDVIARDATDSAGGATVGYGGPAGWGAPFVRTSSLDRPLTNSSATIIDLNADGYDDLLLSVVGEARTSWYAGSAMGLAPVPTKVVAH